MKLRPWTWRRRSPRASRPRIDTVVRRLAAAGTALLLAGVVTGQDPPHPTLMATVTRINDGDSLEVQLESGTGRVRLSAIDTPEYDQPYGAESSAAMKALVPVGSKVKLEVITQDQFRRLVAIVWLEKDGERINVNETMLREGHAWAYRRYMRETRFCDIEADARDHKRGLWAQPVSSWIYPPEWRLLKNGEIRNLPTPYPETREKCVEVLKQAGAATYSPP
jgi:endonuclease YncB( thermonuclease family)